MNRSRRLLPSISALAAFDAVARTGSFTLAAKDLSLTQSAVSRQVRRLEEQLDCNLLERDSRQVSLTRAGKAYVEAIRPALVAIREATAAVLSGRRDKVLRIATLPTFGTRWLMPRIGGFVSRHPEITLNFITRIGRFDFVADQVDLAICHGRPDWPNVRCAKLMEERVVPVASAAFARQHPMDSPQDLLGQKRLVLQSRPLAWQRWFAEHGLKSGPDSGMVFEHVSTLAQACVAGVGVALMPEFLIDSELTSGELVPVGPSIRNDRAYYVAQPSDRGDNAYAELFQTWLFQEAGSMDAAAATAEGEG